MLTKISEIVKKYQSDIVIVLAVSLMTYTGYNLGKIVAFNSIKTPISIEEEGGQDNIVRPDNKLADQAQSTQKVDLSVVASSKSKGKLYHFLWCPGAGQISEQNKLTFLNEAAAIAAGFKLASNCNR